MMMIPQPDAADAMRNQILERQQYLSFAKIIYIISNSLPDSEGTHGA
jgi:hypothetical protein